MSECQEDLIDMEWPDITLGVILDIGSLVCNIPQVYLIIKLRSGRGMDCHTQCLANVAQLTSLMNAFILKYPQMKQCVGNSLGCQPSLLDLYQLAFLWFSVFSVYISFMVFYPKNDESPSERRKYIIARIQLALYIVFASLLIGTCVGTSAVNSCSEELLHYASALGIFSAICSSVTYVPQVFTTFINRGSGALSLISYLIQVVGGYLLFYFQIGVNRESWSTWLPTLTSTTVQFIVLTMGTFFDGRKWLLNRKNKNSQENSDTNGSDLEMQQQKRENECNPASPSESYNNDHNNSNNDFNNNGSETAFSAIGSDDPSFIRNNSDHNHHQQQQQQQQLHHRHGSSAESSSDTERRHSSGSAGRNHHLHHYHNEPDLSPSTASPDDFVVEVIPPPPPEERDESPKVVQV